MARPARHKMSWAWLGIMPFFLFAFLFLLYPSSTIVVRSFQDSTIPRLHYKKYSGAFQ